MRVSKDVIATSAALTLLLVSAVSCAKYATLSTSEPANLTAPEGMEGLPVTGYTTSDGVYHAFEGTVRMEGDSLEFHAPGKDARGLLLAKPEKRFRVARDSVTTVKARAR